MKWQAGSQCDATAVTGMFGYKGNECTSFSLGNVFFSLVFLIGYEVLAI